MASVFRDEIQRIKSANPNIPHREAFSMASKNVTINYIYRPSIISSCNT